MSQLNLSLSQILSKWVAGKAATELEWQQLVAEEQRSPQRAKALDIPFDNVEEAVRARSHLFQSVYPSILSLPSFQRFPPIGQAVGELENFEPFKNLNSKIALSLWNLWLPLAMQLASLRQQLNRPLIQGILGGQGTGKTTLAAVLILILQHLGYRTLSLSLDDLYKTYAERRCLQQSDPRLIWRGPPGTHDVALGLQLLEQLRQPTPKQPIFVPRFDKSAWGGAGDRTTPEQVEGVDIVLFEGWFVGVRPIDPGFFNGATPAPIQTPADRVFARDMNDRLQDYLPLWERLDRLMVLIPTDYHLSQQWRRQAEQQMMATGKSGMTNTQVDKFVEYFWKSLHPELFITPLTQNSRWVDLVVKINSDHSIGTIYCPDNI